MAVAAIAALAAGLFVGTEMLRTDGGNVDAGPLLALALPDLASVDQPLAQWRGKMLIVNFWATWCTPCRDEMPEFVKAQRQFGARGLQFVGIAIDDAPKVRQFADEIGVNYPILLGGYGAVELSRTLGNRVGALPFTVFVDRGGRVVHTQLGPLKSGQLDAFIAQLL
jgi:thiol-disulfide isomerase/thioredoxin